MTPEPKSGARRAAPAGRLLAGWLLAALAGQAVASSATNTPPSAQTIEGCKFYPAGENRRFERVAENLAVGSEIFKLEAHPRSDFKIEPIDNSLSDVNYFKYVDLDDRFVAIKLNQSLEDLVDRRDPQNVLKFKLTCRGIGSQEDSFLPVTVYIHDVNDHAPEFQNVPYHLEVDELTPVGLTIFRSIHAIDRDKPNTANSDITYSIVGGNDNDSFILSDPIEGILVMNKALDYDHGKREFKIQIQASDHGTPSLSSVTNMTVKVKDADDQNPSFSHEVYTAAVSESAQITGKRIREKVRVEPAIQALDQDTGINARLRYTIILGNEAGFFEMNAQSGELYLVREIDLEKLHHPTLSLQIQASQVDNPFRQALARVDISVQDINDNSPEFEYDMYNITVIENLPPGFTVLQVFATDADQGDNAQFKYVLHDDSGAFKIDPTSGWISVREPARLDRETTDRIRMQVSTQERKPNVSPELAKRKRGASVEINLLDSNDNTPVFVGAGARRAAPNGADESPSELEAQQVSGACLNVSAGGEALSAPADCVVATNLYNFNVLETAAPGTQIGHVYAYDRDLAENGRVQYMKQNDSISLAAPFDVNPLNGSIYVLPQFTRLARKQSAYTMFVKATDSAPISFERRHSVAVIQVNVTDINNSVPEFVGATPFEAYVGESLPEGAFVTQIYARDDDSVNEQLEYSIVAGNDEKLFLADSKSGKIYTSAVLDYERKQSYDLLVQVSDGTNTAVAPLIINIIDINDQQPLFAHQFYNFTVTEEAGPNQTVGQLQALDRDAGKNAQLTYSLVGEHANEAFAIEPASGLLRTRRSLDCELEPVIDFQVLARDAGIPQLSGSANVRVRVDDLNDWPPRFELARYEVEVQEEQEAPVDIYQMRAHDRDRDENAIIKYLILGGNELGLFNINPDTGLISSAARLNYEHKREHRLQVAARNIKPFQGPQARTLVNPAVEILIRVADINDELVLFERPHYHWRLSELSGRNSLIGRVNASNPGRAHNEQDIVYWLSPVQVLNASGAGSLQRRSNETNTAAAAAAAAGSAPTSGPAKVAVDERTGEISLLQQLDRDAPHHEHGLKFVVFARDRKSISKLNASAPVLVDVLDVNDNAPAFDEPVYNLEMPENLPAGTTIPAFFKVHDADSGLNGRIAAYQLNGSREELEIFHINNVTGTITLKSPLDFERQSVHRFDIVALDGGGPQPLQGSAQVHVQVANINEFSPKFVNLPYEYQIQENAVPGTQVGQVRAVDGDGNRIVYSMSDGDTDFFAIEPASGKIYVQRQLIPRTQYGFIVRATDDGAPQNYSLGVPVVVRVRDTNDHAPVFGQNSYTAQVPEKQARSVAGNVTLVRVQAIDKDLQNNSISYSIVSGNEEAIFTIGATTGELRVAPNQAHKLDFERRRQHTLLVQAQDSHDTPLAGLTMVQVNVLDVNDHAPVFAKAAYVASVAENAPAGSCFTRVEADARDSDDRLTYSLAGGGPSAPPPSGGGARGGLAAAATGAPLFEVHPSKGLVCTRAALDREQRASYELVVVAHDGKFEAQAPISVEVLDENDNRPVFDSDSYTVSVPYDAPPGRNIIAVHAADPDAGPNGLVHYWIKNTHGLFQIDAKTGQVRVVSRLPVPAPAARPANASSALPAASSTFELRLFAQDQGSSAQIGEAALLVKLTSAEQHAPRFERFAYLATVEENSANVDLLQVRAFAEGAAGSGAASAATPTPGRISYRLARVHAGSAPRAQPSGHAGATSGGAAAGPKKSGELAAAEVQQAAAAAQLEYLRSAFRVDKQSGLVSLVEPLDYELTHSVELTIEARDELASEAPLAQAFVQLRVLDLNDNRPEFFAMPRVLRLPSSTQPLSEVIYTLQALDLDSAHNGNNLIEYKLEKPSRYFNVHPLTGALYATRPLPADAVEPGGDLSTAETNNQASGSAGAGAAAGYSELLTVLATDRAGSGPPLQDKASFEVQVYRDQADDGRPVFNSNQYVVVADAPIEPGATLLVPRATVPNGEPLVYNLSQPLGRHSGRPLAKRFAIEPESGRISAIGRLEPSESPAKNVYHFILRATNKLQPQLSSEAGVLVRLNEAPARCPRFPFSEYYASVAENAPVDSVAVADLVIDDVDRFAGQKLTYQITEDNSNDNFFIDVSSVASGSAANSSATSGAAKQRLSVSLRLKKPLDRESMPKFLAGVYTLTVSAANARCSAQARVKVMVEDQNDNSPQFERPEYRVELRENSPVGHVIAQLRATDADELDALKLRYFIVDAAVHDELSPGAAAAAAAAPSPASSASQLHLFEMEQRTGSISVRQELDREKAAGYLLRVMAIDQANNTGWASVQVSVLDENDWPPSFLNETFVMNATEGPGSLGTRIRLPVFDYDDGLNRQMEVYIVEGNAGNEFRLDVDEAGPLLTIVHELDWEKYAREPGALSRAQALGAGPSTALHTVHIAAKDKGTPARVGKTSVLVFIQDINDNAPKFAHEAYYEFIDESAPVGTVVATLRATDADSPLNTNLTYSFARVSQLAAPAGPLGAGSQSQVAPAAGLAKPRQLTLSRRRRSLGSGAKPVNTSAAAAAGRPLPFALDPATGVVRVARQLDTSEQQQYSLTVEAHDGLWRAETQLRIFVNEVEDPRDASARSADATSHYRFTVPENVADALVGVVDLKPRKLRVNSQIRYSIVNGQMRNLFRIDQQGQLFTVRGLDREQRQQYAFTVMLEERRASSKLTVAEVLVEVLDENDEVPAFSHVYHGTVRENSPPGTRVFLTPTTQIRATDNDSANNSRVEYSLAGSGAHLFQVQPDGSVLLAAGSALDREQRAEYKLDVQATDAGNLSSKTSLTIRVEDENDNAPAFDTGPLFVLIPETARPGSRIVQVRARDRDEPGPHSDITYRMLAGQQPAGPSNFRSQQQQLQQPPLSDVIRCDPNTGELFVVGPLQPAASYNISVVASDAGGLASATQLNVTVVDVNDHRPLFERSLYAFSLLEGNYSRQPLRLGSVRAHDADLGRNGEIEYLLITDAAHEASLPVASPANQLASLLQSGGLAGGSASTAAPPSGPQPFPISVDVRTGELFARGLLDREQRDSYTFKVMALDMGEPALNSTCEVSVKVRDTNDEPPRFYTDPYLALVPENLDPGHKVTQIAAFDPDAGENGQVFYKLGEGHEGKFYIDGKDGTVWTLAKLDYEQKNFYNITIIAYDRGTPSLHSSAKLWITVADMNDAVPNFAKAVYTLEVAENAKLGDTVFVLNAGPGPFKYSWLTGAQRHSLGRGSSGGGSSSLSSGSAGSSGSSGSSSGSAEHMLDADLLAEMSESGAGSQHQHQHQHQHQQHQQQNGDDPDGVDTFTIEPSTGHIKLAKPLDSVHRNHYRLLVRAQDEGEPPKWDTAEINILVGTGHGVRLFAQRLHQVSLLENQLAPMMAIDLNCTDEMIHQPVHYALVSGDHRGLFKLEPDTGRLLVTRSLDRERRSEYTLKVRAETGKLNSRHRRSTASAAGSAAGSGLQAASGPALVRWSASTLTSSTTGRPALPGANSAANSPDGYLMVMPATSGAAGEPAQLVMGPTAAAGSAGQALGATGAMLNASAHLAYDETLVHILVEDENDNAPVFANRGRPIVAAVPLEASFGYEIARVQAQDADSGLNAQIRYEIQPRADDASSKFYVDPASGVVRSMVNFALDNGRVYNFDVRATDRDGGTSANSATIQMFVYVLPETKMVLMVADTEPIQMERRSPEVVQALSNITGFQVKLAKLEPHIEGDSPEPFSTDLFLYAVQASSNSIVDTETLLGVLRQSSQTIGAQLHALKVRRIQGVQVQEKISQMGATEIAIIALSAIVFVGSILAILLLCSYRFAGARAPHLHGHPGGHNRASKSNNSSQQSIWDQHAHGHARAPYGLKSSLMAGLVVGPGGGAASQASTTTPGGVSARRVSSSAGALHGQAGNGSNSTYSTGDGANSSEYVDSLISYKRVLAASGQAAPVATSQLAVANLVGGGAGGHHDGATSGGARNDWTLDSELAAAMDEHHLHHLQHQQHSLGRDALVKVPRARAPDAPPTEVHSDNEVFGDEEEDDDDDDDDGHEQARDHAHLDGHRHHHHVHHNHSHAHHAHHGQHLNHNNHSQHRHQHSHNHNHNHAELAPKTGALDTRSVRSADRSMYSGDSSWSGAGDQLEPDQLATSAKLAATPDEAPAASSHLLHHQRLQRLGGARSQAGQAQQQQQQQLLGPIAATKSAAQ